MRDLDSTLLVTALEKQGETGLAFASRSLGVAFSRQDVTALVRMITKANFNFGHNTLTLGIVLGLIQRALGTGDGLAYLRLEQSSGKFVHCLLVRWTDEEENGGNGGETSLTIGIARETTSARIVVVWPELDPWRARLEDNRARITSWARAKPSPSIRLDVTRERIHDVSREDARMQLALMRAIMDAPDDDAPRLVYADWLHERGDVRGELIALQCERARRERESDRYDLHFRGAPQTIHDPEMHDRVEKILDASWMNLAGDATPYADRFSVKRGFVDEVSMSIAAFEKHGESLFTTAPITTLRVGDISPAGLARLARTSALRFVRCLKLWQRRSEPLTALGESPHLLRLQRLVLTAAGQQASGWDRFFGDMNAPMLEEVRLAYDAPNAGIYRGLVRNPLLSRLRVIRQHQSQPSSWRIDRTEEILALEELAMRLLSLELFELRFGGRVFDETRPDVIASEVIRVFFKRTVGVRLRSFKLEYVPVGDEGANEIAKTPRSRSLDTLVLFECDIGTKGASAIVRSPNMRALRRFVVTGYDKDDWTEDAVESYAKLLLGLPSSSPLRVVGIPRSGVLDARLQRALAARFTMYAS